MATSESKITSQRQVSIPARIRRKLGLTPGSRVEWCERGDEVIVRRASRYSSKRASGVHRPSRGSTCSATRA
ncbi:MAG: AbrB/MazE/SpoVT family DNA-binding domain-containing protein [Acidobacteriota bacterium]|nr:AbrB/MazE/SpoVT family DNA-binding domain-containing protein [Acidobacteriota bacterium]